MPKQFNPRLHNEIYPFISPSKFAGALKGKVAIITGSAGTIGQAIAECFAVAGANLVLVYNRTEPPAELRERCKTLGASGFTLIKCNVGDFESCKTLVDQVHEKVGKADIVVNNAGVDSLGTVHTQDPLKFVNDLATNLHGPYFLMRLLMPTFIERGSGCVVNIASKAGTENMAFNTNYSVSKAALIRLTGCVQKELDACGHGGIHLYAVHPGAVRSSMTSPEAAALAFQAYPEVLKGFTSALGNFKDTPHLSGMVSVALATGVAKKALSGRYFDAEHDLEDVIAQTEALEADRLLYSLHTKFPNDMPNSGGTVFLPAEEPFVFPGF
ncbi:NAD(P)-binding protein [Colletotrichum sublineola]|nr:NAD(P)-binding protein [Colletotrichum sublineola]